MADETSGIDSVESQIGESAQPEPIVHQLKRGLAIQGRPKKVMPGHPYDDTKVEKDVPVCEVCQTDQEVGVHSSGRTLCRAHAPDQPQFVDSIGQVFDPEIHASDGKKPKMDSARKFVRKEHDYNPPRRSKGFPDSGR